MKFLEDERRRNIERRKEVRRYGDGRMNDRRKNAADPITQYERVHIVIDQQGERLRVKISTTTGIEIANEIIPNTCKALSQLLDRYNISMLPHKKWKEMQTN